MNSSPFMDDLDAEASLRFRRMVESVGVKRFASSLGLSTRQVNRMLSGAQPNPVERMIRSLQSCTPEEGDEALSFICQETGGVFVKEEPTIDAAAVNAVRECAEAIAVISDGTIAPPEEREVREAISALTALLRMSQDRRPGVDDGVVQRAARDGHDGHDGHDGRMGRGAHDGHAGHDGHDGHAHPQVVTTASARPGAVRSAS